MRRNSSLPAIQVAQASSCPKHIPFHGVVQGLKDLHGQLSVDFVPPEVKTAVLARLLELIESLLPMYQQAREDKNSDPMSPLARARKMSSLHLDTTSSLLDRLSNQEKKSLRAIASGSTGATWDQCPTSPSSWSLVSSSRRKKGGDEHIALERKADEQRLTIDASHDRIQEVNHAIQEWEIEVADKMAQVDPFGTGRVDDEEMHKELQVLVKKLEAAEFNLASLREEELQHTEKVRGLKIGVWKLALDERVDLMIQGMEIALRSGRFAGERKHKQFDMLLHELRTESSELDKQAIDMSNQVLNLQGEVQKMEQELTSLSDTDAWSCVGRSSSCSHLAMTEILRKRWHIEVLSFKRAHLRNMQLKMMKNISKALRAKQAVKRYFTVDKMVRAGDHAGLVEKAAQLKQLHDEITEQTAAAKHEIEGTVAKQMTTRTQLRKLKHVQNRESDDLRDSLLVLTHELTLRRTDLAWLRKDQLQVFELVKMTSSPLGGICDSEASKAKQLEQDETRHGKLSGVGVAAGGYRIEEVCHPVKNLGCGPWLPSA